MIQDRDVVIVSAARLPVGRLGGALKDSDELTMGATVIKEALLRADLSPGDLDELIMGHNFRSGRVPSNSTRAMAIQAGVPIAVPQITINKHCGAGMKSVILAAQAIKAGDGDILLAGGIEQMSGAAHLVPGARWGSKLGHLRLQDQLIMEDPICGLSMGETAERLSRTFQIPRILQDEFALRSQKRAEAAIQEGRFQEEIVPIQVPQRKKTVLFDTDEHPRFGTTLEKLQALKPVFAEDGTVTAGNSSGLNDGAAALILMSGAQAKKRKIQPMARIVSYASVGVDPAIMGIGPVPATQKALAGAGLTIEDLQLIELNEAFACMCIYFLQELKPQLDIINVNGGAISLGHPIAATGSIILTKLLYELRRRKGRYGLATMCIGGGQGIAIIVEGMGVNQLDRTQSAY